MTLIPDTIPGNLEGFNSRPKEKASLILSPGSSFAERYEIKSLVHSGAFGHLYRVWDSVEGRLAALRIMRREVLQQGDLRTRFDRFLSLAETLEHPNLARVFSHGQFEGEDYFVREFVEGQSLDQIILQRKEPRAQSQQKRTFSLEEVLNILYVVSRALESVEKKTYHGGLTPANILVTDESVRITDLALARIFPPAQFSSLQIYYGNGYYYLAPEYDRSGVVIDQRADLYSAAVMAYEMLTGDLPRTPVMPPSVANADISPGLDGPFLKALDPTPSSRQKNLAHFVEQLQGLSGIKEVTGKVEIALPFLVKPDKSSRAEPSKKRLTNAIERELHAHLDKPVKTPLLPISRAAETKFRALDADPKRELAKPVEKRAFWPWVGLILAFLFAVVLWSLPDYREKNTTVSTEPILNSEVVKRAVEDVPLKSDPSKPPALPRIPRPQGGTKVKAVASTFAFRTLPPKCPADMVFLEAGKFIFGSGSRDRDFLEFPARTVAARGFCVDPYEWPNLRGSKPRVHVNFAQAKEACASVDKRLCTEMEWERACRGLAGGSFPYGDLFQVNSCHTGEDQGAVAASGGHPACRSSFAVYDMSGNAAEWTAGTLQNQKEDRMVRGGSFHSPSWAATCTARKNRLPTFQSEDVGLRRCRDISN